MTPQTPPSSHSSHRPRALIVGSGISGLTTALALHRAGWDALIVERAPRRRTGGYFVRFNGPGYRAAERLGIVGQLPDRRHPGGRVYEVDHRGRLSRGLAFPKFMGGTPLLTLLRSDLEQVLYEQVRDRVEIRYGTSPVRITQDRNRVTAVFGDGSEESADLLVGADGIHSTVRSLVFGPEDLYRKDFGHVVAACVMDRPVPGLKDGDCMIATDAGRAAWITGYADHPPVAFFVYRTPWPAAEVRKPPAEALRAAFAGFGGRIVPPMLAAMDGAESTAFDQVSQIHINRWSQGRVVLVGDSAWCLTLHSGQGSGMGIAGGELLARKLTEHPGDIAVALGAWEQELRPEIVKHQKTALYMQHYFMPANTVGKLARDAFVRVASSPGTRAVGRFLGGLLRPQGAAAPFRGGPGTLEA
ncbi:FAD-dependent monooxygenase [Streptomyces sp. NPDC002536]